MAHYRTCGCVVENDIVLMPCAKHSRPKTLDAVQSEVIRVIDTLRNGLETEMLRILANERSTLLGLLRKYGNHIGECYEAEDFDADCTCGWDEVFRTLEEK
jgi:hypothetical protein